MDQGLEGQPEAEDGQSCLREKPRETPNPAWEPEGEARGQPGGGQLGVRGIAGTKVYGDGTSWEFSVARDKLSGNVPSFSLQKLFPGPVGATEKGYLKVLEDPWSWQAWREPMNTQCGRCWALWVSSLRTPVPSTEMLLL